MDKSILKGQDIENHHVIRKIEGDLEPTGGPRLVQRALRICLFSCYDPLKGSWLLLKRCCPKSKGLSFSYCGHFCTIWDDSIQALTGNISLHGIFATFISQRVLP